MKTEYKLRLFSIFFISSLINSTIIKEGYHFFDIFYYRDIYKTYLKQKKNNKCEIDDGPNCIYIQNKNLSEIGKELNSIYPDNNIFLRETTENIYLKLKNEVKYINDNKETSGKSSLFDDDAFSLDSPYVMSLLLSFESYDEKTKNGDIYAPEVIDTPFEMGSITLTVSGKLRLTQKNSKNFEIPIVSKEERPRKTYAFVESKQVLIKFNLKSTVMSLYIKKNKYNQNNKSFYLYGYKNDKRYLITKVQNVPSTQWIKVNGDGKKYDGITLERGFDYDNIVINSSMEGQLNYNTMTKQFSSFLNKKISDAINQAINNLDRKNIVDGVKVIKINVGQEDIIKNKKEEDFDIPEEIMKEINKEKQKKEEKSNKNKEKNNKNENKNNNLNNKNDNMKLTEDL